MTLGVALRKESVDRNNKISAILITRETVALRKESVDRNHGRFRAINNAKVALRKESVDRNSIGAASLTAHTTVALRKESVDRNREICGVPYSAVSRSPQGERG